MRPAILVVDEEPVARDAAEKRLSERFCDRYDVLMMSSSADALETIKQRGDVAMVAARERMAQMDGPALLRRVAELAPDACRVLISEGATRAPGDLLHAFVPVTRGVYDEALLDAIRTLVDHEQRGGTAIRVIGHRWSPDAHQLRDFFARSRMPIQWLDVELSDDARRIANEGGPLPLVVFPDGTRLAAPTLADVAEKLGMQTDPESAFYDLVIVGGGPAGLSAAVYAASEGIETLLLEREVPGGQAGTSAMIENYLGFPGGLSGAELARRALEQARKFGAEILAPQTATALHVKGTARWITLANGTDIGCRAIVIASGLQWRRLPVPGADRLTGRGVYYGAASAEARACRGEEVWLVGGANSAGQAAMHFAQYASVVHLLVRSGSMSQGMSQYLVEQIANTPSIKLHYFTSVSEVHGDEQLEALTLTDSQTGETKRVAARSLYNFIGATPITEWLGDVVQRDDRGYVLTGRATGSGSPFETSVPGIFAVGDVVSGSVKRVASAVG
ncbi:MAG TPA: FAD-dependent oxidoreductase, partial [Thermoanaerobaculia bacterium]